MHTLLLEFPVLPTPRERIARRGGTYKPPDYLAYQRKLKHEITKQLFTIKEPLVKYYVGILNVHTYKPRQPDGDNIEKGLLDALVQTNILADDSRKYSIGSKKRNLLASYDVTLLLIGSPYEEIKIDQFITRLASLVEFFDSVDTFRAYALSSVEKVLPYN